MHYKAWNRRSGALGSLPRTTDHKTFQGHIVVENRSVFATERKLLLPFKMETLNLTLPLWVKSSYWAAPLPSSRRGRHSIGTFRDRRRTSIKLQPFMLCQKQERMWQLGTIALPASQAVLLAKHFPSPHNFGKGSSFTKAASAVFGTIVTAFPSYPKWSNLAGAI